MDATDSNLEAIVQIVGQSRDGVRLPDVVAHLNQPGRTVQRWLADLVEAGRLKSKGKGRATRYVVPRPHPSPEPATASDSAPADPAPAATVGAPLPPTLFQQPVASTPETQRQSMAGSPATSTATIRQAVTTASAVSPAVVRPSAAARTAGRATADTSSGWQQPPADAPFARYPDFEELYYHIFPRIVRTCMNRTNAESVVREQADFDYRTDPKRKLAFIAAAMAKLDSLTLTDVHPYGVGPATYGDWRRGWNEPPGTRHW